LRLPSPLSLAAGAIGVVACTHLTDFGLYHLRYTILNANSAGSWSHFVAAGALAVGAAVCLAGARRWPRERTLWIASAAMLALFFLDETSGLHARIDVLSHGKLVYGPVLVVLTCCVWALTRRTPYVATVRMAAVLLAVSYVIHVLEPHDIAQALGWSTDGWAFQVVVALKEGTELAGVLLALSALTGAAFASQFHNNSAARLG